MTQGLLTVSHILKAHGTSQQCHLGANPLHMDLWGGTHPNHSDKKTFFFKREWQMLANLSSVQWL